MVKPGTGSEPNKNHCCSVENSLHKSEAIDSKKEKLSCSRIEYFFPELHIVSANKLPLISTPLINSQGCNSSFWEGESKQNRNQGRRLIKNGGQKEEKEDGRSSKRDGWEVCVETPAQAQSILLVPQRPYEVTTAVKQSTLTFVALNNTYL